MPLFELVIALLLGGAVLSAWARRISVPYPALLALAGAVLALLPDVPSVTLDPELALALFVAPVLLDAAFDSSPRGSEEALARRGGPRRRRGGGDGRRGCHRRPPLRAGLRVRDVATSVIVQFLTTFGVWILAERLRLSGIITMVTYAILVARTAPARMPARLRIPSYAVWEVAVFVLNVLAFILVGLQLKPILQRLDRLQLLEYLATAAAVCAAVLAVRMLWALAYALAERWASRGDADDSQAVSRTWLRSGIAIGWSGMRGIVTIAAGLALPAAFPGRDLVLFTAFCVVLLTLVLQGGTLAPLMRLLRLEDDGTIEGEVRRARAETARAALEAVGGVGEEGDDLPRYAEALLRAQAAERRKLLELRGRGVIGDDAFHRVEEELDWADLHAEAQRGTM